MKRTILLFWILLSFTFLNAQELNEIDARVIQYPNTFNEPEELAELINNDFDTEEDKARAIYTWISMNVKFDLKTHFSKKKRKSIKYKNKVDRAQKLRKREISHENKALKQHLAVAEGYSLLYKRLCDLTGIYGYIIKGTAKLRIFDIGKEPRMQNHMWNVIQIEKDWFFVDATMGAGTVDYNEKTYMHFFNDKFFFTPPEKFFLNHFPKEKGWTLLEKTADDFAKLPLFFGEYLRPDFELLTPKEGVLDLTSQDSIQFRIKSPVPIEGLTYQFSYQKEPSALVALHKNDEYTFDIPFVVKRRGYLNLFYKKMAIMSFKIGAY